jgi:hypothetical protein
MSSRYIPFVQQPYCCVPTCFQIVMYKRNIPLLSQDELAYEMGLMVPEKDAYLFNKVHVSDEPSSGWGTQIQKEQFHPNTVFPRLSIPLRVEQLFIKDLKDQNGLKTLLQAIQKEDGDALVCFDYGKLWDLTIKGGHVCVFDRIDGNAVYLIDPERNVPKYRKTDIGKLFEAMDFHGDENAAGVWNIHKVTV